jgi:hypothetical protein
LKNSKNAIIILFVSITRAGKSSRLNQLLLKILDPNDIPEEQNIFNFDDGTKPVTFGCQTACSI